MIDFNAARLGFKTSIFFLLVCIYSTSLSPSSLNQGRASRERRKKKKKKEKPSLFGVYRIKEEVNIISITFEPVNHQHNADKHYCKRLTMPMRQELCDLPLRQRGGKRAQTWRRSEVNCALPASLSKQPPPSSAGDVLGNRCLTLGGGLMDAVPKVSRERIALSCNHTAWGELHCFR